ncbi:MAG: hypothetical protein JO266_15440 [Acidobacteria bacterium]|nr:hypothetical protein [Acidobacteriota bacterium]
MPCPEPTVGTLGPFGTALAARGNPVTATALRSANPATRISTSSGKSRHQESWVTQSPLLATGLPARLHPPTDDAETAHSRHGSNPGYAHAAQPLTSGHLAKRIENHGSAFLVAFLGSASGSPAPGFALGVVLEVVSNEGAPLGMRTRINLNEISQVAREP